MKFQDYLDENIPENIGQSLISDQADHINIISSQWNLLFDVIMKQIYN